MSAGQWLWHLLPYQDEYISLPPINLRKCSPLQLSVFKVMVMTWKSLGSKGIWSMNWLSFHRSKDNFRSLNFGEGGCPFMQPDLSARKSSLIWITLQRLLLTLPPTHGHLLGHGSSRGIEFSSYSWVFLVSSTPFRMNSLRTKFSFAHYLPWEDKFRFVFGIWLLIPLDTKTFVIRRMETTLCSSYQCLTVSTGLSWGKWG